MDCNFSAGFTTVRVAAANLVPWKWHRDWNADRMEQFFVAAAKEKVDLVVEPEACLEGYVAYQAILYPELRDQMAEVAEPIDGRYVQRFRRLARQLKTSLVFGMAERRGKRDVYNTALFIDHRGRICGTYQKMQLAEGYDPSWNFDRLGKQIRAFDTPLGRCGMLICNDRWNPLIPRALCLDGAQFLCILTYGSRSKQQDAAVLARARENGVPIVQTNVGRNLVVSKGEIVALDRGCDRITIAEIAVPDLPCPRNARKVERAFLEERPQRMRLNLEETIAAEEERRQKDAYRGRPPRPRRAAPRIRDHTQS